MNIDEILQRVQDLRSNLDTWGVTNEGLWAAGVLAALLFIFSLREVLTWYFRVNQVRDEVKQLRIQMSEMQKAINDTRELLLGTGAITVEEVEQPLKAEDLLTLAQTSRAADRERPEVSSPKKFRLDH